ncbi:MAG: histidine kinase [Actinomycetota bacterium]|nr:histidine kinase [Actinomycetota bacterium]
MTTGPGVATPDLPTSATGADQPEGTRQLPRDGHTSRVLAPVLGLFAALLVVAGFSLGFHLANLHNGLIAAAFTGVGLFVLRLRPGHREGWLFIATGVAHGVMFFGRQYGLYAVNEDRARLPGASWVMWFGVWPLALVLVLIGVTMMCFPDGRLPSPAWRPVVAVMVLTGALLALVSALWPVEYTYNSAAAPHPLNLGGYDAAQRVWEVVAHTSYLLFQLVWVVCVVVRLRRAEGDEARQLKWFAYAVAMGAVAMALGFAVFGSPTLGVLAVPVVPIAAGVAIVKYHLYDIDVVISKTLVVSAMAGIIAAAYGVLVVGVGRLVGAGESPDPVLSFVVMVAVAVAFEPVLRRVQRGADRLVYGRRPTPYEALARLSTQVSVGGQSADLLTGLASTLAEGVGAADVTLWVGSGEDLVAVAWWPPGVGTETRSVPAPVDLASLGRDGRTHVRPIVHQGTLRGAVTLTKAPGEALAASEDRLLRDLVAQAGLVIDNVGLGVELQERLHQISLQAAELRAAAKRIVAAQDAARRRIERDLHDGAQQRLVTLALSLQDVSSRASSAGDPDLAARVDESRHQLARALAELRDMARGIHPAILTQEGFEAAVLFLAERSPIAVQVEVRLDERLPEEVEATAYYIVSEALTNAAKHSAASNIVVKVMCRDGRLSVEVTDNGRGGADGRRGSGLQGLTDRLATLSGGLAVHSPVGHGTHLKATIPCG